MNHNLQRQSPDARPFVSSICGGGSRQITTDAALPQEGFNTPRGSRAAVWRAAFLRLAALGAFSLWSCVVIAQVRLGSQVKDFVALATDDEGRTTTVRGKSGKRLPNGQVEIEGMVIETQSKDMVLQAPHCLYDAATKIAFSPGKLVVRTSDDRFSIEGEGFSWHTDKSRLVISNRVHTLIKKPLLTTQAPLTSAAAGSSAKASIAATSPETRTNQVPSPGETLEVHSDQFDYRSDLAVFRQNVRAKEAQGHLTCGILKVFFASDGKAERVEAEQNVVFDQNEIHASGEKAVYLLKEKQVTFSGNPRWKIAEKEGSGEVIIINNEAKTFRVERRVSVKLLPDQMVSLDWLAAPSATNAPPQALQPVTIAADELDYRTELAVFRGHVQITDAQGASLACQTLTNIFAAADGKLVELIADRAVEFKQGQTTAKGERAVYRSAEDLVTLTGNPTWKLEQGEGKADKLVLVPKSRILRAEGRVAMKLFGQALGELDLPFSKSQHPTNAPGQEIEVLSDNLQFKTGSAIFVNNVRMLHPMQPDREVTCVVLAAFFVDPDSTLDQIIAEEKLTIRQGDLRATGDKVVYWVPRGLMELTGQPQILTPGRKYTAQRFILDRTNASFRMKGSYKIQMERGPVEESAGLRQNKP